MANFFLNQTKNHDLSFLKYSNPFTFKDRQYEYMEIFVLDYCHGDELKNWKKNDISRLERLSWAKFLLSFYSDFI